MEEYADALVHHLRDCLLQPHEHLCPAEEKEGEERLGLGRGEGGEAYVMTRHQLPEQGRHVRPQLRPDVAAANSVRCIDQRCSERDKGRWIHLSSALITTAELLFLKVSAPLFPLLPPEGDEGDGVVTARLLRISFTCWSTTGSVLKSSTSSSRFSIKCVFVCVQREKVELKCNCDGKRRGEDATCARQQWRRCEAVGRPMEG